MIQTRCNSIRFIMILSDISINLSIHKYRQTDKHTWELLGKRRQTKNIEDLRRHFLKIRHTLLRSPQKGRHSDNFGENSEQNLKVTLYSPLFYYIISLYLWHLFISLANTCTTIEVYKISVCPETKTGYLDNEDKSNRYYYYRHQDASFSW